MTLSPYHQKYASQDDGEIAKRAEEKKRELALVFEQKELKTDSSVVEVAVLGCGDKRFIPWHKEIFSDLLKRPVKITTFDITIDHLEGGEGVRQHDCTLPIPDGPYDITFAHVLLKFIETEKQWNLIRNSYDALKEGGMAIHIMDKEDFETKETLLKNGQYSVPLDRWKAKLAELNIKFLEVPVRYGLALVLLK